MNKEYWNNYYKNHMKDHKISGHSSFSKFCLDLFFKDRGLNIIEIGSGNGRDAIYLARHGHTVYAIDQSNVGIDFEKELIDKEICNNLIPIVDDFTKSDFHFCDSIDVFFSRFTLHAITMKEQDDLIPAIYESLVNGGLLCIEVRTINDHLFGVGENCGDNTFLTDHKRRFIDAQIFIKIVLSIGFKLLYFTEEDNLSIYKEDNPVLMRIILKK